MLSVCVCICMCGTGRGYDKAVIFLWQSHHSPSLITKELCERETRLVGAWSLETAERSRWVRVQQVGPRHVSPAVHIFVALEDGLL